MEWQIFERISEFGCPEYRVIFQINTLEKTVMWDCLEGVFSEKDYRVLESGSVNWSGEAEQVKY